MSPVDDQWTRQQAQIIAKDLGFIPHDPLKCERVIGEDAPSSIFYANTPNVIKCFIQYDSRAISVVGFIKPNVEGTYSLVDLHNGENFYMRTDGGWFLWWDNVDTWNLSNTLGVQGDIFWTRTHPDVDGAYIAQGTAEGTPTIVPSFF